MAVGDLSLFHVRQELNIAFMYISKGSVKFRVNTLLNKLSLSLSGVKVSVCSHMNSWLVYH